MSSVPDLGHSYGRDIIMRFIRSPLPVPTASSVVRNEDQKALIPVTPCPHLSYPRHGTDGHKLRNKTRKLSRSWNSFNESERSDVREVDILPLLSLLMDLIKPFLIYVIVYIL